MPDGQLTQTAAPAAEYVPAMQRVQLAYPAAEKLPATQVWHWEAPSSEKVPARHETHAASDDAPAVGDAVPAGHGLHSEAPTLL